MQLHESSLPQLEDYVRSSGWLIQKRMYKGGRKKRFREKPHGSQAVWAASTILGTVAGNRTHSFQKMTERDRRSLQNPYQKRVDCPMPLPLQKAGLLNTSCRKETGLKQKNVVLHPKGD